MVRSSDEETTLANDRLSKADGYHAIPPPITGNFLTPRAKISFAGLDEYAIMKKIIESKTTEINTDTSKSKTSETVCKTNEVNMEKPKSVQESVVTKQKINKDKVIIKDWYSDDDYDVSKVNTVSPVKTNVIQTVQTQVDKIGPNGKRAVHTVSTARPFSTASPISIASPISTARPFAPKIAQTGSAIRPIYPRMDNVRPRASYSPIKRSYYSKPAFRPKNLKQDVKTSGVKNMTTARTRAVVNTSKGKMDNALKKSSGALSPYVGNKAYLLDYEDYNGCFVAFGSDPKGGKITGKGKIKTAYLDFDDVYFVDELKFNLFSVSQMCDKKISVLFTDTECHILSLSFKLLDESQVVLRAPKQNDVYNFDLKNIVPSGGITCLYANTTSVESKLWHRRLGHVNFKNINKLVKGHLVRGLPSKVFVNDHTCVACKKGKQHKASCKAKLERTIRKPLELLHIDLFGPVSVESINKKSLENQLNHKVKIIRCDHGTEFKNHAINEFCAMKGIKREFSVARTPPQNGKPPSISFMRLFGCPLTILNTLDPLGKFDRKSDEGYLLGYSTTSKAFRVYKKITKRVEENMHIDFLEDQPNVAGSGPDWMFDLDFLTNTMNYIPASVENHVNMDAGTKEHYVAEIAAKSMDDATRQAFEKEKKRAAQATSINKLNTSRPFVSASNSPLVSTANTPYASAASTPTGANTGGSSFVYLGGQIPIDAYTLPNVDLPIDPNMPDLEDDSNAFPNNGIFRKRQLAQSGSSGIRGMRGVLIKAIRLFLSFTSFMGFPVYQMDVKSAFLYGTIREEVKQKPDGIFFSQDKYVVDILKNFDFCSIKIATTPIESNKPLVKDKDGVDVDVHVYSYYNEALTSL
ncbi:putative ribonuclease H-like domain-containing protein [Tanacetum coccineum]|uniref:Ribonuclease H-like domain-containing protein n=1 Tax=Tanacetum coccineum TaxID=301880 RepID=A0ABQ4Z9A8_9ASTR